jgi:hypothetical protein
MGTQTSLDDLLNALSKSAFGENTQDLRAEGKCIECEEPALSKCYSDVGKREYGISGLCEVCWDNIIGDDE